MASATFDDAALVSSAGLVPALRLACRAGLAELVEERVTVAGGQSCGWSEGVLAGGGRAGRRRFDCRHGCAAARRHGRLFTGVRAPSTLGTFLGAFRFGHVRQLDAVAAWFTAALAACSPIIAAAPVTYRLVGLLLAGAPVAASTWGPGGLRRGNEIAVGREKSEPEVLAQRAWEVHALAMRLRWPDWVVVAVCTVAQLSSAQPGNADHREAAAGSLATVAALFGGIILVWRRRAPLRVLGGAAAAYVVQAAAAGPVVPAAVLAGCYAGARYASLIRGVAAGLLAVAVVVGTVLLVGPDALAATYAVPLLLAVLVGVVVAARQAKIEATMASVVLEERLRIARDLHDVVGHGMAAITVQAGAARMALAAGADAVVRGALLDIEQAGRGVLREVRWLVGVLRDRPEHRTISDLAALADAGRNAGFAVQLRMQGNLAAVPPQVAETAYRIVQEGLTNAFR